MGLFGLTDYENERKYKDAAWQSRSAAFDTAGALRQGGYSKPEAENLYQEQMPAIEQGASRAANTASKGYGNRGLGGSGMALAAQNDVAMQRAIQSRQARLAAINTATGNQFRNNVAAMGGYNTIYGQDSGNYNRIAERNQSGITSLMSLGLAAGGAAAGYAMAPGAASAGMGGPQSTGFDPMAASGANLGDVSSGLTLSPEILAMLQAQGRVG